MSPGWLNDRIDACNTEIDALRERVSQLEKDWEEWAVGLMNPRQFEDRIRKIVDDQLRKR